MKTLTYKNEIFNIISSEEKPFSIASEVIDNGIEYICENNKIFFLDKEKREFYEEKHCNK